MSIVKYLNYSNLEKLKESDVGKELFNPDPIIVLSSSSIIIKF